MSVTLHYTTIFNPCLVDIVDDEWAAEKLPDDGMLQLPQQDSLEVLNNVLHRAKIAMLLESRRGTYAGYGQNAVSDRFVGNGKYIRNQKTIHSQNVSHTFNHLRTNFKMTQS